MNYMVTKIEAREGDCRFGSLQNVNKDFQLRFGTSRAAGFPAEASFFMDEDFPRDLTLTDALSNDTLLFVASARLRDLLAAIPGALFQNEILPVKIINHKGRQEKSPYFIINQLDHPVCLKEDECIGKKFRVNPKLSQIMKKMVLDESNINRSLMLFRVAEDPYMPFVRRELATTLAAKKP